MNKTLCGMHKWDLWERAMQRRDVLKLLGSGIALSALPHEAMAMLAQAGAEASGGLKTLNPHQNATVILMAEMIIPATDTPGATGAKVNEFMDLLLTEWYEPAETSHFLSGLAQVDEQSRKQFGKDFLSATAAQQTTLLQQLDASAMTFAKEQKQVQLAGAEAPSPDFFYQFKKLTLAGYYTSQIGFSKELGKTIIPPRHAGCAPCPEDSHVHANG